MRPTCSVSSGTLADQAALLSVASYAKDPVEAPRTWDASKCMLPGVFEQQAAACNEVLDGPRDQHLARPRLLCDALAGLHRDATHVPSLHRALAGVESRSRIHAELVESFDDRAATPDRSRRPVEGGEVAFARGIYLLAAEPSQFRADHPVVPHEQ